MNSSNIDRTDHNPEDEIKTKILVDNTSQGIFKYLTDIENQRDTYSHRWAYELIQNALDSSRGDKKLEIDFSLEGNFLRFAHNGRPFKKEEVAHLIYHGSTKRETDLGKFGTGFLVTHLLSKEVKVSGFRDDGKKFNFGLDRNGSSADEIAEKTETSWRDYVNSLSEGTSSNGATAEYEYHLDGLSTQSANVGIEKLKEFAAFILAFNDRIESVKIITNGNNITFRTRSISQPDRNILYEIDETDEVKETTTHQLLKSSNDDVELILGVRSKQDGTFEILDHEKIPKLFVGLPMIGTTNFPSPCIINSTKLEPNEERDNVYLGKESTANIQNNKDIINKAFNKFPEIFDFLVTHKSTGFENILRLPAQSESSRYDLDWLSDVEKSLIDKVGCLQVVKNESGGSIKPNESVFPIEDELNKEDLEKFWKILHGISFYKDKLPSEATYQIWISVVRSWEAFGLHIPQNIIMNVEKLSEHFAKCRSLKEFGLSLSEPSRGNEFLQDFYSLLKGKFQGLLEKNILINQNDNFVSRRIIFSDSGIDERLKDISKGFGQDLRDHLLRNDVPDFIRDLISPKTKEEVLDSLKTQVSSFKSDNNEYIEANVEFFAWLLDSGQFESLEGFPLVSQNKTAIKLTKVDPDIRPLAPTEFWGENGIQFSDIFQDELVVSSIYSNRVPETQKWITLAKLHFLRMKPIYTLSKELNGDDLEKFCVLDDDLEELANHEFSVSVKLSNIAHFNIENKGIYDTIRRSREKARRFIDFIFQYVLERDSLWHVPVEVTCKCGNTHQILASTWLCKLKQLSWIPTSRNHSEPPSSQNLAKLIGDDPRLLEMCKKPLPAEFLRTLGISYVEMLMSITSKDGKVRAEIEHSIGVLFDTFRSNPANLSLMAQFAGKDPELFLKEVKKSFSNQELVRRNKETGTLVERLLKYIMEREGLKLTRTGIGSDYSVENDFFEEDSEVILKVEKEGKVMQYLEIKSTHENLAKITPTQAKKAAEEGEKFVLAVVKLDTEPTEERVEKSVKFIYGIGSLVKKSLEAIASVIESEEIITKENNEIKIEWKSGQIRFIVGEAIWSKGKTFEEYISSLKLFGG